MERKEEKKYQNREKVNDEERGIIFLSFASVY
jgi:hypothetical protein